MTNIDRHKHTQTNTQGENIITSLSRVIKMPVAFTRMCVVDGSMSLIIHTWWRHQMETFSALLVRCEGNPPVTGGFLSQRPVTRSFDISFEPWWGWLFETPSCPLWRRCNVWLLPIGNHESKLWLMSETYQKNNRLEWPLARRQTLVPLLIIRD